MRGQVLTFEMQPLDSDALARDKFKSPSIAWTFKFGRPSRLPASGGRQVENFSDFSKGYLYFTNFFCNFTQLLSLKQKPPI